MTVGMHHANEFLLSSLDLCSDFPLLGVSAVKLDAPPGLTSGSPVLLLFKLTSGSFTTTSCFSHVSSLIAPPLSNISCSILVGQSSVCGPIPILLGILSYVRNYPDCSVVSTTFSHVYHLPTHPFVGSLVLAACSLLLRSTDTQVQELQIPSVIAFKAPHLGNVFSLLL